MVEIEATITVHWGDATEIVVKSDAISDRVTIVVDDSSYTVCASELVKAIRACT